jgi:subtilase family serine protease
VTDLLQIGYTGAGQTIVIIDSYGSPTIASDLHTFDAAYGLPDPPSFQVIAPLGTVPFDSTDPVQLGWAGETTLDVEWAHAIAPGANIVLLTSPVAETQGVPGMPQFLELEQYALDHKLGKIISQSWGRQKMTCSQARTEFSLD